MAFNQCDARWQKPLLHYPKEQLIKVIYGARYV